MDAYPHVKTSLSSLQLENEKDYFKIGIDAAGKRAVEGLLPSNICQAVWHKNTELVHQVQSDNKD